MYRKKPKEVIIEKMYRKCIEKKLKEAIIENMQRKCIEKNLKMQLQKKCIKNVQRKT